jgi:NitT/TauT family transport system substrate-binding protein
MAAVGMSSRRALAPLALGCLGLVAAGCSRTPDHVSVPVSNWPGYEYFYLAEQAGLAREQGVSLSPVEFADPQAIVHAYLRGDLAIAQLTTVEAVDICARVPDRCPVVVLVLDESVGGDQVMARQGITAIEQLRGKRVGVTLSTLGPYVLSRALELQGLSLGDVKLHNITLDSMPAALARGSVDAVAVYPPYSEYASRQGNASTVFDSRSIPGEIFDVLVVDPQALEQQKGVLPPLLRSWQAAHDFRRREPRRAVELMARREGLRPAEFIHAERGLRYFSLREQRAMLQAEGPLVRALRRVRRVQNQLKLVSPVAPMPRVSDAAVVEALR